MKAIVLEAPGALRLRERPLPEPGPGQVRLRVSACGVCRTDLHVVDGDLPWPGGPVIPGHQVVGVIDAAGPGTRLEPGARVGVPWLGTTCGSCRFCASSQENLCGAARFTGYQLDGGFAEACVAAEDACLPLPDGYDDVQVAPLLCAGLIGHRALGMCGDAERLGLYGFGASAHVIAQVAAWQGRTLHAFTRPGDGEAQALALRLGCAWAGGSDERPPEELDAAILFAPVGALVPTALGHVRRGGVVVCAGIHMSDVPSFPYELLWGERTLRSVANLSRADGRAFLDLAPRVPVVTEVTRYALAETPRALDDLRGGRFTGAAVVVV